MFTTELKLLRQLVRKPLPMLRYPFNDVRSLWQAIVRHIMPSPVIGGTFEVAELWDTMNMDRTKQGEVPPMEFPF